MVIQFRGGPFDGRRRDVGPKLPAMFEAALGGDRTFVYEATDEKTDDGATIYTEVGAFSAGVAKPLKVVHATLPWTVHFHEGPENGKGRHFAAEPAEVLVLPLSDGEKYTGHFARYKRAGEQLPGRPLIYKFVEKFEGDRTPTPRAAKAKE